MTHRDSVSEVSVHGWLVCGCGLELMQCIMGEINIESSSPDGSKEANSPKEPGPLHLLLAQLTVI